MMNNFLKMLVIVIGLAIPFTTYGQSSSKLYQKGETLMQSGKYSDAINAFNAAMKMDSSLESSCKVKIWQCQEKINQRNKAKEASQTNSSSANPLSTSSHSLQVDKEYAEFGWETRTPVQIKVHSNPKVWDISSDEYWCTVSYSGNTALIKCETNDSVSERFATVTVSNGYVETEITVLQKGKDPIISLGDKIVTFKEDGGRNVIDVNANCDWEIKEIPDWCKVYSAGDKALVIDVEKYKKGRMGVITLGTKDGGRVASAIIVQEEKKGIF